MHRQRTRGLVNRVYSGGPVHVLASIWAVPLELRLFVDKVFEPLALFSREAWEGRHASFAAVPGHGLVKRGTHWRQAGLDLREERARVVSRQRLMNHE